MKLVEEQTRGRRAQDLLDNEVLAEALDAIEAEVVAMWSDCPSRDTDGKEALWQLMKTSKKFRSILLGYIKTGNMATENIARFEEKRGIRGMFRA
ncbi:MAG: hypothetical protein Q7T97_02460 [Burkholderiaceae bacterium]|nr:hypothetical protein [Burkholderiaceae bacterium]